MPKQKKPKVVAIFIAYNAESTLKQFWKDFPKKYFGECILIDDASQDETYNKAKKLKGLKVYRNNKNLGYGGNMKRAVSIALARGADIIVDIHPDGEYKPTAIPHALNKVTEEGYEFVMGNRFMSMDKPLKSGMYAWKILPIMFLNYISRLLLQINISDFHQGFRVYTKKLFEEVSFESNSDDYLFSFEIICQAVEKGIKISDVPVETIYEGKKRGASLKDSIRYSINTFPILGKFILSKFGVKFETFRQPKGTIKQRIQKYL